MALEEDLFWLGSWVFFAYLTMFYLPLSLTAVEMSLVGTLTVDWIRSNGFVEVTVGTYLVVIPILGFFVREWRVNRE